WFGNFSAVHAFFNLLKMIFVDINGHQHHLARNQFFRLVIFCKLHLFCILVEYMTVITFYAKSSSEMMHNSIKSIFGNIFWQHLQIGKTWLVQSGKSLECKNTENTSDHNDDTFFHKSYFIFFKFKIGFRNYSKFFNKEVFNIFIFM